MSYFLPLVQFVFLCFTQSGNKGHYNLSLVPRPSRFKTLGKCECGIHCPGYTTSSILVGCCNLAHVNCPGWRDRMHANFRVGLIMPVGVVSKLLLINSFLQSCDANANECHYVPRSRRAPPRGIILWCLLRPRHTVLLSGVPEDEAGICVYR